MNINENGPIGAYGMMNLMETNNSIRINAGVVENGTSSRDCGAADDGQASGRDAGRDHVDHMAMARSDGDPATYYGWCYTALATIRLREVVI